MELWDGYYKDGSKADITLIRGNKIPKGLYHLVCEILVKHKDGTYLLMLRDNSKPNYPGLYEASAGGSALKGEDKTACAMRELKEETGITADKLEPITTVCCDETHSIYHVFMCETDCDKNSVTLQEGETSGYRWTTAKEFKELAKEGKIVKSNLERMHEYLSKNGLI